MHTQFYREFHKNCFKKKIIMEFEYVNEFYITQFSLDIRRPLLIFSATTIDYIWSSICIINDYHYMYMNA